MAISAIEEFRRTEPLLAVDSLSFAYPGAAKRTLCGACLDVHKGEFLVLIGESGCGKTTLLRHLKPPISPVGDRDGEIWFEGKPLSELSARAQAADIGFVFQNIDNQIVTDKVWHELSFGLENLGVPEGVIRRRVAEIAGFFGINNWFHADINTLSGGQKQLLNLASVMVMQPKLLILDEPTSQLDPNSASKFLDAVYKVNRELAITVLMTEHRLEEVFSMADRVAIMQRGEVVLCDRPRRVVARYKKQGGDESVTAAFPSAARIYSALDDGLHAPISVREGRAYLERAYAGVSEPNEAQHRLKPARKEASVELKDVWFRYERRLDDVLRGVTLKAHRGELLCILGGNGSGKSTMLSVLCGLRRAQRGSVRLLSKKLQSYNDAELYSRVIGLLPQDPQALFVHDSVREDLSAFAKDCAIENPQARIFELAQLLGLTELMERHPYDLSGGEQQKAALAKILMRDPEIIVLDEPTKGLDAAFKQEFAKVLKALLREGKTVVMATHDVEFAAEHAHTCALCFDGSIISEADAVSFFSGNGFYTTAANRICRALLPRTITVGEVVRKCKSQP